MTYGGNLLLVPDVLQLWQVQYHMSNERMPLKVCVSASGLFFFSFSQVRIEKYIRSSLKPLPRPIRWVVKNGDTLPDPHAIYSKSQLHNQNSQTWGVQQNQIFKTCQYSLTKLCTICNQTKPMPRMLQISSYHQVVQHILV